MKKKPFENIQKRRQKNFDIFASLEIWEKIKYIKIDGLPTEFEIQAYLLLEFIKFGI